MTTSSLRRFFTPRPRYWLGAVAAVALFATACGSPGDDGAAQPDPTATPTPAPTATPQPTEVTEPTATPTPAPTSTPESRPTRTPEEQEEFEEDLSKAREDARRRFVNRMAEQGWDTDFSKWAEDVRADQIRSGGPARDQIPSIDNPEFAPVSDALDYMRTDEPVISMEVNGEAKAYPLSILTWHEIVNDGDIGGQPVTVTFCPLCNTAIAFDRNFDGQVLDFGVSGQLRASDLIMYDRQTETWWQQATGRGIVGEHADKKLEFIPAPIIGWEEFMTDHPDGKVLLRPDDDEIHPVTGRPIARDYERPPYAGYDTIGESPFLFDGPTDGRLSAMRRVATIGLDGMDPVAYPFNFLRENPVVNDTVGDTPIVVFFDDDTESAFSLGGSGSGFKDAGAATVYDRRVDGEKLTFSMNDDGQFVDDQTGSVWNMSGKAVSGELEGTKLEQIVSAAHFWFAWAAFSPDTEIRDDLEELKS